MSGKHRERRPREKPGTFAYGDEWRERVARGVRRYNARRRAALRIRPADLEALSGRLSTLPLELRRLAVVSERELEALVGAVGGDQASPQRVLLAQDVARLGLLVRALMLRFGHVGWTERAEIATRVSTLVSARRAGLQALGLEEQRQEVDLARYLAERASQKPASGANGGAPVVEAEVAPDRGAEIDGAREEDASG